MSSSAKILVVSTFDMQGGAARAAYRLFNALRRNNIDAQMLVRKKSDDNQYIHAVNKSIPSQTLAELRYLSDKLPLFFYKNRENVIFSTAVTGDDVLGLINRLKPDLVHLHWINRGFLKIEHLAKIKVPVIWSMHDMWPFTGGCHYSGDCSKFTGQCGTCPILKSTRANDVSTSVFIRKKKAYARSNITFVGLSRWLQTCAKSSAILRESEIVNLPNPIDTSVYKPIPQKSARDILNFHPEKPMILFGAMDATGEKRKGFAPLLSALKSLDLRNIQVKVLGSTRNNSDLNVETDVQYLGNIFDDTTLALLYSAANVTIVPSLQENLSNVIMESLSCGTPVVAFNIGGNCDMVEHLQNGYLARPNDSDDLAFGINWVIQDTDRWNLLSQNARSFVMQNFEENFVAAKYINLYKHILNAV